MSTPSAAEPKRPAPTEVKQTSNNPTSTPIPTSRPQPAVNPSLPQANGIGGDATPTSGYGGAVGSAAGAQGLSAALAEVPEQRGSKDRSNAIDRQLEDDSRKFKKECKILLLGEYKFGPPDARFWRIGQVDHCQANENHPPKWVL